MRLEIGGGAKPRGDGWVNVDHCQSADVVHDLNARPWPFENNSVDAVYSCHCLEHLRDPMMVLNEVARVCKVGAAVEIRTPYPHSHLAMVWDHVSVFSPHSATDAEVHFPHECWLLERRLKLVSMELHPTYMLEQAKKELPFLRGLDDQTIMRWIPGTCHETRFFYTVQLNEYYK